MAVAQTSLAQFFAVLCRLKHGFGRVPVTELVLCHLVGIHIDGILQPFVVQNLRCDCGLPRAVGAGYYDEYGAMLLD